MARIGSVALIVTLFSIAAPVAQAKGPHFLAEAGVGMIGGLSDADTTDLGIAGGIVLGVGGRPAGSWLRYYFLMEFLAGEYGRQHDQNYRTIELARTIFDAGMGLRVVVPITPQIRFFGDILGVLVVSSTEFTGDFLLEEVGSSELDGGFRLGTGLQFRPIEMLSLGARFGMTTTFSHFDDDGGRGWLVGFDSEYGHWELGLQASFYF
ncbi:MAG: outer membrane beta-barrel protein [Bradymonadales bacterium]|nr:outer membrane beta-barrel protein [Bradymonadales bacterium]